MTPNQARANALAAGADAADIEAETERQYRFVGTVSFNNMIRALQFHPWLNSRADWVHLAAALHARAIKRRHR